MRFLIKKNIYLLAILILFFLRFIKPFFYVRLSNVDLSRIGGIYHLDWELSKKKYVGFKSIDIFFYSDSKNLANTYWKKIWSDQVILIKVPHFIISIIQDLKKNQLLQDILIKNIKININGKELELFQKTKSKNIIKKNNFLLNCVLNNKYANVKIYEKDIVKGEKFLKSIGAENKKIICIHNRDDAYLNNVDSSRDWSYHNFRDFNINDFEDTIIKMIHRGYFVIRMGSISKDKINFKDKNFFDYSNSDFRSDFLDIFLLSKCKFLISSDSGISAISEIFRVPIVYVNKSLHWENHRWSLEAIVIYKKFFSIQKNRYLTFEESYKLKLGNEDMNQYLKNKQIKIINNTRQEILEASIEMDDYLNQNIKYSDIDEELQNQYWNIFSPNNLRSKNFRIGNYFLHKNKSLL